MSGIGRKGPANTCGVCGCDVTGRLYRSAHIVEASGVGRWTCEECRAKELAAHARRQVGVAWAVTVQPSTVVSTRFWIRQCATRWTVDREGRGLWTNRNDAAEIRDAFCDAIARLVRVTFYARGER